MSDVLNFHRLHMDVSSTVCDLSGQRTYDVDSIVRDLMKQGVRTVDDLNNHPDPDWFWNIVEHRETTA